MRALKAKPLKMAVIGTQRAGKTSLINRFQYDTFDKNTIATVGASFVLHLFETDSGDPLTFQIWDTAGQEKYRALGPIYYRDAACAVSVFDLTSQSSFEQMKVFIDQFREHCSDYVHIAIVGNKKDLYDSDGGVDLDSIRKWATGENYSFHLTSALTGDGVKDMFQDVARIVGGRINRSADTPSVDPASSGSRRQCC